MQTNDKLRLENQNLLKLLKIESSSPNLLHNQLEDIKGKVRVYCRIRPMLDYEIEKGCKNIICKKNECSFSLKTKNEEKIYGFDACFFESSNQVT